MKQKIIASVIVLSLLAAMPTWGQTNVIKRTPAQQPAKVKTGPQWKWKGEYSEGLAAVEDNGGKRGYIDQSGKLVISCKWKNAWPFHEGVARVTDKNAKHGYIDKTGTLVIPCKWWRAGSFSDGLAQVSDGDQGYIDKTGTLVIPCKWGGSTSSQASSNTPAQSSSPRKDETAENIRKKW